MEYESLWQGSTHLPQFPVLKGDIKTDVLIIGGGIAGILTAYFLHQKGVNYVLAEQNRICGGVTGNTTAKITLQHGLIYHKILKSRGMEITKGYYEANKIAMETYSRLCNTIDCDYTLKDNYVYSLNDSKKLFEELTALQKIGCNALFCKDLKLPINTQGAVCAPDQAQFHPLKFLSAISKDLNIYEQTKVREMVGNTAVTSCGKIIADNIVVTTHFPFINKHGSYFLKLYQHRSYVLALRGAEEINGMYVDENDKGFSFRNYRDLLVVGGGGHRTGKKGGSFWQLKELKKEHFPDSNIVSSWATQDCMSLDSVPYIGKYSAATRNLYVATGFNKWGMSSAMVAAQLLCDMLTGVENEFAQVFNPSRSILKPQLFINGIESVTNLLTSTTKRCPHLGCALKWNRQEHSWDCPCHGSRFSEDGKLINGPATDGIIKQEKQ